MGLFGTWIKVSGVIVARRATQRGPHGIAIRWSYVVDVHPTGEPSFRAEVKDPFFNGNFVTPRDHETVALELETKSRKVRFDKSDPRRNYRLQEQQKRDAENAKYEQRLHGKKPE